ncbi:16S rRNA (guanine(527)-N(7))-methyltransferase RsmG [Prevotella sp.]|uniref:16S rRNA (guanine(527)-N(7))-methyltransferase RsmG n=1 Tax=Prevotella sp. TaxID=59823 RepID=UPI002F92D824
MELINKYFKDLTETQRNQFAALAPLYKEWNEKINVISRKDIANIYEHHVLHSLAIAKEFHFKAGSQILDFGCGGGFPGIPLAILFPECHFKMIDGTGKKVMVAREIAQAIGLKNAEPVHLRGEEEKGKYDFIVSRAVMPLPDLMKIVRKNLSPKMNNARPNGVICLKGGQLDEELKPMGKKVEVVPISNYFEEEWFAEKFIVYSY